MLPFNAHARIAMALITGRSPIFSGFISEATIEQVRMDRMPSTDMLVGIVPHGSLRPLCWLAKSPGSISYNQSGRVYFESVCSTSASQPTRSFHQTNRPLGPGYKNGDRVGVLLTFCSRPALPELLCLPASAPEALPFSRSGSCARCRSSFLCAGIRGHLMNL